MSAGFNLLSPSNATVMVGDISYLFYVNSSSNLGFLWFKGPESMLATASGDKVNAYDVRTVNVNGDKVLVNKDSPQVTAVSYRGNDGRFHIRVYYIDPSCLLRELCVDVANPDEKLVWFKGNLNSSRMMADPKTALASLVQVGGIDQLKVYFKGKDEEVFYCGFANVGSTTWTKRDCFEGA